MIRFAQQVSRAIRILRGNRDESARASHLVAKKGRFVNHESVLVSQAEREKCSQSTFSERKIMSTKTAFKRVALIAAAALAIGGISAVSAQAGTAPQIAGGTTSVTASGVTGTYVAYTLTAGSADKYYTISSTGGTVNYGTTGGTGVSSLSASGANELWYSSTGGNPIGVTSFGGAETTSISLYSATAGTQVVTIAGNSSTAITITITWGAAPVLSAANSLVVTNNAADIAAAAVGTTGTALRATTASADSSVVGVGTTSGVVAGGAVIGVYNNASTPAVITADTVSASVSGPGLVAIATLSALTGTPTVGTLSTQGRSVSVAATAGFAKVILYSDGTTGTSTVTVSDSTAGVTLGTFTVTFYSNTIAKLVATTNYSVPLAAVAGFAATPTEGFAGSAGTTAVGAPVSVVASDANGNAIPGASTVNVASGTTAVATVAATASYDATNGYYYPVITPVSEGSTVLTFTDAATGLVVATATVWVVPAVAATVVASTDNTSYDPGTKVVYTLTATTAKGNPIADGTYTGFFSTAPTSNVGLQGALPGTTSVAFKGGVNASTLYAPLATANVAIAGGTVIAGFLSSATATATNEADFSTTGSSDNAANAAVDAANEATDAANAATDAANAAADSADAATQAAQDAGDKADAALAAVTALSQQVTNVLAKIASISALLVRIIKKVKA